MKSLLNTRQNFAAVVVAVLAANPAGAEELPDFTGLVSQNSPAVVNISTTQELSRDSLPRDSS